MDKCYKVTVTLLLHVDDDGTAYDAVNEILREQQRAFNPHSCLIDYTAGTAESLQVDLHNYTEGDMA